MDSHQNLEKTTPSKSLLNTVHNKLAHSTFGTSPFKRLCHSTPPSRYTKIKNPFETHLADRLHTHFFSPSVFKLSSPKVDDKFQWTIDEISSFYPADIDEAASGQYESHKHDSVMESTAQAKIDLFFSEGVAPSPINQQINCIALIPETETPIKTLKETCDGVAQTVLSLPIDLPEELELALRPYFNHGNLHEDIKQDSNVSLHKRLFESDEVESVVSSPPPSVIFSPITSPDACNLDTRFHSPFKLDDCHLSPIGMDFSVDPSERKSVSKLNHSGYMSVDSSLIIVPDVGNQLPNNDSINFDTTNSPLREVLSDSTVNWDMEFKHIATDTPCKKREIDVSNSNTPKSKIFTSQRKKLSDSFLKEDEFTDEEHNVSIDEIDIYEAVHIKKPDASNTTDAGYHTGILTSNDLSWCYDTNLFASTPTKSKKK